MPKTIVRENETIEDALKRFKRDVSRSGTLAEARKREHYLKPSDIKKMKKRIFIVKVLRYIAIILFLLSLLVAVIKKWHLIFID